jgi:hypothetical protein
MSAPKAPPDNSMMIEQMRQQAAERQRAEERAAAEQKKQQLAELRTGAANTGRSSAQSYFTGRGLDPGAYAGDIDSLITSTLSGIGPEDPNPGSYFSNIGETAFNRAQDNARTKYARELDKMFAPNYELSKIPWTLDDPYLASIESEGRSEADQYIRNLLDRGVITNTGYQAATSDLEKQAPGVRSRLNEIGTTTLAEGQGKLKEIGNRGRQTASTLALGTPFDPYAFSGEADTAFNEFIAGLGDAIRGKAPKQLFDTAGLGAIAGAGQGALNTRFDPEAMAGVAKDKANEDEEEKTPESIF